MTLARHSASPAVSGIDGAVSPSVQAAVAGSSPAKFRPSDFALGGVEGHAAGSSPAPSVWAAARVGATDRWNSSASTGAQSAAGIKSGPSAPFNDCGGVDGDTRPLSSGLGSRFNSGPSGLSNDCGGLTRGEDGFLPAHATRPEPTGTQSPICPELTAYITTLLAVVGAIAWAHVFAMQSTLVDQLINFHPRVMFCDAVGTKAGFVCAVRHKEGE